MKLIYCKDETSWIKAINSWLETRVRSEGMRLFLPAGDTPRPLYRSWEASTPSFLKKLEFMQLDEILTGSRKMQFKHFFQEELPSFQKQFCYIEEAETVADLSLLGLGMNGHVAFHEPGINEQFYSGCVKLNRETTERLHIESDTKAVTYGVQAFMKSKSILMIVRGPAKKDIVQNLVSKKILLPASQLLKHSDFTLITDFEF